MADPLLRVENLVRRFGGIVATDNLSLEVAPRRVARDHRPERRRQDHADQPVDRTVAAEFRHHPASPAATSPGCRPTGAAGSGWRARSRSPRCCRISPRSTMSRWPRRRMTGTRSASGAMRARRRHLRDAAQAALSRVGLERRADVPVSELSHGEQRELELAVALATKPQLLLLDEPMAGLGVTESARMVTLLKELRQGSHHRAGRARHGGGVRARRPHHRPGLWPRHRLATRRTRSASNEEVKRAYLGEQHAVTRHG